MKRNTHLALAALALAGGLVLTACGNGDSDAASTGSPTTEHGASHGTDGSAGAEASGEANAADISFLTGMTPHHEQAVEMSEVVPGRDGGPTARRAGQPPPGRRGEPWRRQR